MRRQRAIPAPLSSARIALVAALSLLSLPSFATSQVVVGRVIDAQTLNPVVLADLALVDSLGRTYDRTFSTETGGFQLTADGPGSYYVMASSVGYELGFDGVLDMAEGGQISVEFYLKPKPIELAALTVTGSQIEGRLETEGFFDRMDRGFGTFFDTEEIEESGAMTVSNLLNRLPGVYHDRIVGAGSSGLGASRVYFRDTSPGFGCPFTTQSVASRECLSFEDPPGYCTPNLFVDGASISGLNQGADVDAYAQMNDVAGIEVYTRTSSAPIEYAAFTQCGVILIWTKQGAGGLP